MIILTTIVLIVILSNQNQQKDILTAIAVEGDNTQQGFTTIKFSKNDIVVGDALSHEEGSAEGTEVCIAIRDLHPCFPCASRGFARALRCGRRFRPHGLCSIQEGSHESAQ